MNDLADAPIARGTIARQGLIGLHAVADDLADAYRVYRYADGTIVLTPALQQPQGLPCPVPCCPVTSRSPRGVQIHLALAHRDWAPPRPGPVDPPPVSTWAIVLRCGDCLIPFPGVAEIRHHTLASHGRTPTAAERTPER